MGYHRFYRVKEGFSQSYRKIYAFALYDTSYGVAVPHCAGERFTPVSLSCLLSCKLHKSCINSNGRRKHLLCHNTCSHKAERDSAGEVSASADVVVVVMLDGGCKVCVPGSWRLPEERVVLGPGIGVIEENCNWSACCIAVKDSGDYVRLVRLHSWSGTLLACPAA